jgi:hypothetical protein
VRRFSGIEKGGLVLAAALIIGGFCMVVHPMEMFVPASGGHGRYAPIGSTLPERVSQQKAREIGAGVILSSVAFAAFIFYRPRE